MHKHKPHGQWLVLQALITLPPFGNTDKQVYAAMHVPISFSGTQARLKELRDMKMVRWHKEPGQKRSRYFITRTGWKIATSGVDGMMALRIARATAAVLEAQRAVELAPIKTKWQRRIENEMRIIASGL